MATTLQPIHPAEILREEFLKPFGLSVASDGLTYQDSDILAVGKLSIQIDVFVAVRYAISMVFIDKKSRG
jgi:hypothetical protein